VKVEDQRLIEDYIPVEAISIVAQREKIGHAALHPRKLHLWWARRPLAAARAAVYATLVPVEGTPGNERSDDFFVSLCQWGASDQTIAKARERVLAANGGVPPKVLDLFAGGGAIPIEAARLGCDATAVELNPVAHLVERCTLDYPQRFGPDLADDIREYGRRWVDRTWERVGDLYPRVRELQGEQQCLGDDPAADRPTGRPIAYLWTRTVPCPNTAGGLHEIPLVRQTWLAKKKGRYVALKPIVDRAARSVSWRVVEADSAEALGFDPAGFSSRGKASCLVCGATVDAKEVKALGRAGKMGMAPLAAVALKSSGRGREYLPVGTFEQISDEACDAVLEKLDVNPPDELIDARYTQALLPPPYGLTHFGDLFTRRQLATLCSLAQGVREAHGEMIKAGFDPERAAAVSSYLALALSRTADRNAGLCRWDTKNQSVTNVFSGEWIPMPLDFVETNPFGAGAGQVAKYVANIADIVSALPHGGTAVECHRSSATDLPFRDASFDAVVTDPPYYDNISYADLSDFFYVWLKRSIGFIGDEFTAELTPKRRETVMASHRHGGDKLAARRFYESEMAAAFGEAHRVLKPGAPLVCVYAHKTTMGWAALVEALRVARFTISEAWPLDTEMPERARGQGSASLASSIFLVARRRDDETTGVYHEIVAELDSVIEERLERLTRAGVSGSDLVIATIGAALRPFTKHASVELPSGEPVAAETFLSDVQTRVLDAVLAKVHDLGADVGAIDATTRYYVLSRTMFGWADIDFDEANNLARTAGVELKDALASGPHPLANVKGKAVHLRDFEERGAEPDPGLSGLPLIDVLHGVLWRANHSISDLPAYLIRTRPDIDRLRAVAQALQGKALRDENESKAPEAQACERLLGSWRTLVERNLEGRL
jgi:putative DNA methylase